MLNTLSARVVAQELFIASKLSREVVISHSGEVAVDLSSIGNGIYRANLEAIYEPITSLYGFRNYQRPKFPKAVISINDGLILLRTGTTIQDVLLIELSHGNSKAIYTTTLLSSIKTTVVESNSLAEMLVKYGITYSNLGKSLACSPCGTKCSIGVDLNMASGAINGAVLVVVKNDEFWEVAKLILPDERKDVIHRPDFAASTTFSADTLDISIAEVRNLGALESSLYTVNIDDDKTSLRASYVCPILIGESVWK